MAAPQPGSYDALAIAHEVANESKGIQETVDRFINAINHPLTAYWQSAHDKNLELFQKMAIDQHPLGITFARYENGALVLCSLDFSVKDPHMTPLTLHVDQYGCVPGKEKYDFLAAPPGFRERFLREHPGWPGEDTIAAARLFVQQAIDEHVPSVGPPLSLLVISSTGTHWNAPGLCQDIQK